MNFRLDVFIGFVFPFQFPGWSDSAKAFFEFI